MISRQGPRRSLSQAGGPAVLKGDPETARVLALALEVDPRADLPFTHGFHPWPARMHPETARRIVEAFPAARIADPFVGSGTVAVEAVRAGRPFTGVDVSRVAIEVAWARTRIRPPEACRLVEREAALVASDAAKVAHREFPVPSWAEPWRSWFPPVTLREAVLLHERIGGVADADLRRLLNVVLSSIVVKLSRQAHDSVPVADREYRPWKAGTSFRFFRERAEELTGMLLRLSSNLHKRKVAFVEPEFIVADTRAVTLPSPYDLVLSSPPYPGVYDYAHHHRLRFPLFGDDGTFAGSHEIGAKRAPGNYEADLAAALKRVPLGANGRIVLLIGDGTVGGQVIRTDILLGRLKGYTLRAIASQERGQGLREHLALLTR